MNMLLQIDIIHCSQMLKAQLAEITLRHDSQHFINTFDCVVTFTYSLPVFLSVLVGEGGGFMNIELQ